MSLNGMIYTCMMLFMGLAAINSQANLLFGVFGLMIGVLLVTAFISRMVVRKLEVRRILPDLVVVGQPITLQYEFENIKRFWPSLSVTLSELSAADACNRQPQAYLLHVAAGASTVVPTQVVPLRRGLLQLDHYRLFTSFPFGFVKRAVDRHLKDTLLVHPALARVDQRLLSKCLSAERSGARMRPRRGGTDEFYGVKEYRQGENPRWIYWKRSARTGTLVAREMTHVAAPRLMVMVDTFVSQRTLSEHAAVERAIAMAASMIQETIDKGMAVGLYVWSGEWVMVPTSRGKRHCRELLAILAKLPLNTIHDHNVLLSGVHQFIRSGTTAMMMTPRDLVQNLADQARGNWIIVASQSDAARHWFHFDPGINFEQSIPTDQLPG